MFWNACNKDKKKNELYVCTSWLKNKRNKLVVGELWKISFCLSVLCFKMHEEFCYSVTFSRVHRGLHYPVVSYCRTTKAICATLNTRIFLPKMALCTIWKKKKKKQKHIWWLLCLCNKPTKEIIFYYGRAKCLLTSTVYSIYMYIRPQLFHAFWVFITTYHNPLLLSYIFPFTWLIY